MDTIFTIGVYGSTKDSFFSALKTAKIDKFIDVRARRGLRGSLYSYANSTALQAELAKLGIPYIHLKELAPSEEVRAIQDQADKRERIPRRSRACLDDVFKKRYRDEVLSKLDVASVLKEAGNPSRPVFFCVEHDPEACHRSMLASVVAAYAHVKVVNLIP